MQRRILVYLPGGSADFVLAHFTQSVVDRFAGVQSDSDSATVYTCLAGNKLYVSDTTLTFSDSQLVQIKRPAFCPVRCLTPSLTSQLSADTLSRGIDVGVALILETCDERVLLTRRASHLRTFPGVWVPPGGHVELDESLVCAVLRELKEETGLTITLQDCVNRHIETLALWESTYPPMLSLGLPVRHHIVVYLHARLCDPLTSDLIGSRLSLDPGEVSAAAWITVAMVRHIVAVADSSDEVAEVEKAENSGKNAVHTAGSFPREIEVVVVSADGRQSTELTDSSSLLHRAPSSGSDIERVSTGTKFALQQWLHNQSSCSS